MAHDKFKAAQAAIALSAGEDMNWSITIAPMKIAPDNTSMDIQELRRLLSRYAPLHGRPLSRDTDRKPRPTSAAAGGLQEVRTHKQTNRGQQIESCTGPAKNEIRGCRNPMPGFSCFHKFRLHLCANLKPLYPAG